MATHHAINLCSACNINQGKVFCPGCKKYFCLKDVEQHERQLMTKFANEIIRSHDKLLDQIQKFNKSNNSVITLFQQIEQWQEATTKKVRIAADKARQELMQLVEQHKTTVIKQLEPITREIRSIRQKRIFEDDINRLKRAIRILQQKLQFFSGRDKINGVTVESDETDWNQLIYIRAPLESTSSMSIPDIRINWKWTEDGVTVAGGNGPGNNSHQLNDPRGVCIADDQTVYVADYSNHRVVEWKVGATSGRIVAGGNGQGNDSHQLNYPIDIKIDKRRDCLIISDYGNRRIVQWPIYDGTSGETIVSNIRSVGLAIDEDGLLYVSDCDHHLVRRYRIGESQGTIVAGGNGRGNRNNQLSNPWFVCVDRDRSLYVTDYDNHRVMKWKAGSKRGIIVAGNQGQGSDLKQLSCPGGIVVDQMGAVYIADQLNHRIVRWSPNAGVGTIVVGGNGAGNQSNQLNTPSCLSFDQEGNIYAYQSLI